MTVGMHVPMALAVAVGVGRGHGKTLYYNITSVHRLVCNCQHYPFAYSKDDRKKLLFCSAQPVLAPLNMSHARRLVANGQP
jgi:hypothetical protein